MSDYLGYVIFALAIGIVLYIIFRRDDMSRSKPPTRTPGGGRPRRPQNET